jgi:hypothetical protein
MRRPLVGAVILLIVAAAPPSLRAQRVQLPSRLPQAPSTVVTQFSPNTSTPSGSTYLPGGTSIAPAHGYGTAPPASTTTSVAPTFDPYAQSAPTTVLQPGAVTTQPVLPPAGVPVIPGGVNPPVVTTTPPPYFTPAPAGVPYTTSPPAIYPNGLPPMVPPSFPTGGMSNIREVTRFLQEIRLTHEWIYDDEDPDAVEINSTEVSATFAIPAFGLRTPFLITPGFALHLFDGPDHVPSTGLADLPPETYDGFLDVGWNPQVNNWFGAELGVRTGVYTDFDHFSTDSFRIMGRGIAVVRVTPTLAGKLGVLYIDRNDIKLLPVFGVVWDCSPDAHYEIVFPRPKLARRWMTLANHNLWYYLAGEYGGGSWTVVREPRPTDPDGFVDAVDYNDLRVVLGLEWLPETQSGLRGFLEIGYVFNRELFYVSRSPDTLELDDTFMFRGGIAF